MSKAISVEKSLIFDFGPLSERPFTVLMLEERPPCNWKSVYGQDGKRLEHLIIHDVAENAVAVSGRRDDLSMVSFR